MKSSWKEQARSNLERALARLFAGEDISAGPGIKNAVLRVEAPKFGFVHEAAVGKARADSDAPMTPQHQFHLASVAKTMTATLLLQLVVFSTTNPCRVSLSVAGTTSAMTLFVSRSFMPKTGCLSRGNLE